ncbi:hypothetical protein SLI_0032 [Streptomyces lividans 1326]|uniref:Uncharacterized protein n=1 Tax=Streptomyces lividans 1326 TaxID=1200984 RepID=A0A7U9DNC1_STRLI|nr:hypothetical protein SLI_0032 [Streptomyces lividans 1326]
MGADGAVAAGWDAEVGRVMAGLPEAARYAEVRRRGPGPVKS